MHARQSFLNICNTAILGYHGDKIILNKSVNNIKYGKKSQIIQLSHLSGTISIIVVSLFVSHFHLANCHLGVE